RDLILLIHFFSLLSGGHSSLEPRLPIPNRTVKRVCADDSVPFAHAKVGYRQTIFKQESPGSQERRAFLFLVRRAQFARGGGYEEIDAARVRPERNSCLRGPRTGQLSIEARPDHGVLRCWRPDRPGRAHRR